MQGAKKVREKHPEGIFIFLIPPSLAELRDRITKRGTETADIINKRMDIAKEEIEMMDYYDYVVQNDEVDKAVERVQSIVTGALQKRTAY